MVKVAEGYGRNFLLPRKLAIEATVANKTVIEQMKAAAVRRSAKEKSEAEALVKQFDGLEVSFTRKSGENDQLFGSVTASDIAEALEKKSFHIDRRKIQLHESLKTVGEFTIADQAAQGRDHAPEGGRREGSGGRVGRSYCDRRVLPNRSFFRPFRGSCNSRIRTHGSRRGLHSFAASRLLSEKLFYLSQVRRLRVVRQALHKHPPVRFLQNSIIQQRQQAAIMK